MIPLVLGSAAAWLGAVVYLHERRPTLRSPWARFHQEGDLIHEREPSNVLCSAQIALTLKRSK